MPSIYSVISPFDCLHMQLITLMLRLKRIGAIKLLVVVCLVKIAFCKILRSAEAMREQWGLMSFRRLLILSSGGTLLIGGITVCRGKWIRPLGHIWYRLHLLMLWMRNMFRFKVSLRSSFDLLLSQLKKPM